MFTIKLALISFSLMAVLSFAQDKQRITLAAEHYPPYEMEEPINGLKGFDYEVIMKAFSLLGYEVDVEFLPWKRVIQYSKMGRITGLFSCAYRKEREDFLLYSNPISESVRGFYTRKDFKGVQPILLEDVRSEKVGSVSGYGSTKELESSGFEPIAAVNTEAAISMLLRKRFDYLYLGQQGTDFLIMELGLADQLDFHPISRKDLFLCFSKKHSGTLPIVRAFNAALFVMKQNGTYRDIHDKYK
jgi:polar amino acid transport system substrate-binding protein